jgi:hypothetical protein
VDLLDIFDWHEMTAEELGPAQITERATVSVISSASTISSSFLMPVFIIATTTAIL